MPEHHAERQVHALEHRPLLDVQLEVGGRALAAGERDSSMRSRSTPWAASASGSAVPSRSRQPAHAVRVERAGAGARAEQAAAEARALLVGPVHELHGQRRRGLVGERAQHLERRDDVERAVQPAAVGHGVEVAADDHAALGVARQRRPGVAGLVALDLDAVDLRQLAPQPVLRGEPRSVQATRWAPSSFPVRRRELAQARDGARRVDVHQPTARPGAGWRNDRGTKRPEPGSADHLAVVVGERAAHVDGRRRARRAPCPS